MQKHILIVSYVFPPYPGIGGRRWAKFSKYLSKKGYSVHVVCSLNPFSKKQSLYYDDVKQKGIVIHSLSSNYPNILLRTPIYFIEKIKYHFFEKMLKLFFKGSPYDRAIFWEKNMLSKCRKIIEELNINTVIATGAPFRVNYFSIKLKKYFPNIKLINDLRDPWTWGHGYGMNNLSEKNSRYEWDMETKVINASDIITVPIESMVNHLKKKFPDHANKIINLPHSFDEDEVCKRSYSGERKKKLLLYGTLYDGLENEFEAVSLALKKEGYTLSIISYSDKYQSVFAKNGTLNKQVFYNEELMPKELFQKFNEYDYILLLHNRNIKDHIATKFYEIVYSGIPVIYIGADGKAAEFIKQNNVGAHILPEKISSDLPETLLQHIIPSYKLDFNIEDFSFSRQTDFLIQLIENKNQNLL